MNRGLIGALCLSVTFALLAGCGGTQIPGQAVTSVTAGSNGKSMINPQTGNDLLYVSGGRGTVLVYSYPQGQLVNTLSVNVSAAGECVDSAGNVFVTSINAGSQTGEIYEYAHGGTKPIAQLADPGYPNGCAVDPKTGNLAVANVQDTSSSNPYPHNGDVAIYAGAKGGPAMYYTSQYPGFGFCGYDPNGNLYLSSYNGDNQGLFVRLANGSSTFEVLSVDEEILGGGTPPSVQWDGHHMTISSLENTHLALAYIYRLRISGSSATVVGTVKLANKKEHHIGQIFIDSGTAIGISGKAHQGIFTWKYPKGGTSRNEIATNGNELWGVVLSHGSSR